MREEKRQPCRDCGVSYPYYVMEFDHLRDKKFNLSDSRAWASRARLIAEITKCEVVCANCHAERSHQRVQGAPSGEQRIESQSPHD